MQRQLEMLSAIHLSSDPKGLDFEGFSYADHEGPQYILLHGGIILKICFAVWGMTGQIRPISMLATLRPS